MKPRAVCLSVSRRNKRYLDLIEDYSLEFNLNRAQTIFRIIGEYNTYRCLDGVRKWRSYWLLIALIKHYLMMQSKGN